MFVDEKTGKDKDVKEDLLVVVVPLKTLESVSEVGGNTDGGGAV
jgi:hypothetical protein